MCRGALHHKLRLQLGIQSLAHLRRLKQELEMKRVALELLRGRVEGSESAQLAAATAETEVKLGEARAAADAARKKKSAMARAAQVGGDTAGLEAWKRRACTQLRGWQLPRRR